MGAGRSLLRVGSGMEWPMHCRLGKLAVLTCALRCALPQHCRRVSSAAVSPSGTCRTLCQTAPAICITCRCRPCLPPLKVCAPGVWPASRVLRGNRCSETYMLLSSWDWSWALLNPAPYGVKHDPETQKDSFGVLQAGREGTKPRLGQRWLVLLASLPSVVRG